MSADAPGFPPNAASQNAAGSKSSPASEKASGDAQARAAFVALLKERHAAVAAREAEALAALEQDKDQNAYRKLMTQRAQLVAALDDEDLLNLAAALPPPLRDEAASSLRRFAGSARQGLGIGSVFYYSSLLYPDDHRKGEPDNLLLLIRRLELARL